MNKQSKSISKSKYAGHPDYILNPKTNRWVKRSGSIGQKLLSGSTSRAQPRAQAGDASGLSDPTLLDGIEVSIEPYPIDWDNKGNKIVAKGPFTILAPLGPYHIQIKKEIKFSSGQYTLKDIITRIKKEYGKRVTTELDDLLQLSKKEGHMKSFWFFDDLYDYQQEGVLELYALLGQYVYIESFKDVGNGKYSLILVSSLRRDSN